MTTQTETPRTDAQCIERITDYLMSGGLWNPELAIHDNVRDLLIDCRKELAVAKAVVVRLKANLRRAVEIAEIYRSQIHIPDWDAELTQLKATLNHDNK